MISDQKPATLSGTLNAGHSLLHRVDALAEPRFRKMESSSHKLRREAYAEHRGAGFENDR